MQGIGLASLSSVSLNKSLKLTLGMSPVQVRVEASQTFFFFPFLFPEMNTAFFLFFLISLQNETYKNLISYHQVLILGFKFLNYFDQMVIFMFLFTLYIQYQIKFSKFFGMLLSNKINF